MILATGCAGFIGSNVVHIWLAESGEAVVNLDKLTYAAIHSPLRGRPFSKAASKAVGSYLEDEARVEDVASGANPRWLRKHCGA